MDLEKIKVDVKKEEEGDWIDLDKYNPDLKGARVLLRSPNNRDYKDLNFKLQWKRNRRGANTKAPKSEEAEDILAQLYARTIILDWEGIEEGSVKVECTPEEAYRLLSSPEYRVFANAVVAAATEIGESETDLVEQTSKNLKRESTGS
jgi:hypothetical protein